MLQGSDVEEDAEVCSEEPVQRAAEEGVRLSVRALRMTLQKIGGAAFHHVFDRFLSFSMFFMAFFHGFSRFLAVFGLFSMVFGSFSMVLGSYRVSLGLLAAGSALAAKDWRAMAQGHLAVETP